MQWGYMTRRIDVGKINIIIRFVGWTLCHLGIHRFKNMVDDQEERWGEDGWICHRCGFWKPNKKNED